MKYSIVLIAFIVTCSCATVSPTFDISLLRLNINNSSSTIVNESAGDTKQSSHGSSDIKQENNIYHGFKDVTGLQDVKNWSLKLGNGDINYDKNSGIMKISSNGYGETYIQNRYYNAIPGEYIMTAELRYSNVTAVGNQSYHRGKFQAIVVEGSREIGWPDDDFQGSYNTWKKHEVSANISKGQYPYFRIGFQDAKGVLELRNIHIYKK
jgi:hypothetical protein